MTSQHKHLQWISRHLAVRSLREASCESHVRAHRLAVRGLVLATSDIAIFHLGRSEGFRMS